jgi:sugar phosphate isomerase/epimerase
MPEFSRVGVRLAIENHDRFDSATLAWIIAKIGTKFAGVCLDTVNSFGALEGPREVVGRLARHAVNLHLKDFTVDRVGSMLGFAVRGAPAGRGRLDVPWILRELKARKREMNAIIELWTPWEGSVGKTVALEDKWAEESVRNMRQYIRE